MMSRSLEALAEQANGGKARGLPPVHLWNPPFCGDIDLVIKSDGRWLYGGTPIARPAMVKLFASILKREGERYFLVTPQEKVGIQVEDAPLFVTAMQAEDVGANARLYFETATGDHVLAGADHPLAVRRRAAGDVRPYLHIRSQLEALIARPVFYELAALAVPDPQGRLGVWSHHVFFPLEPVS